MMLTADPTKHLEFGTPDRRCWNCGAWSEWEVQSPQRLGDCTKVRWMIPGARHATLTHADDVCAKFEEAHGRTPIEAEQWAIRAGLG